MYTFTCTFESFTCTFESLSLHVCMYMYEVCNAPTLDHPSAADEVWYFYYYDSDEISVALFPGLSP